VLLVGLVLPATLPTLSLSMPEADTLAAGTQLAGALAQEGAASKRLKQGFSGVPKNPRVKSIKRQTWMAGYVEAPLPRWVSGLAIANVGRGDDAADWSPLDRSRFAASFALGLALALLFVTLALLYEGTLLWPALAVVGALALPGVIEAGTSVGYAATLMMASAALVVGTLHTARGGSGVWAGMAWGLCLACHPAALFLLVPTLAAIAIGRYAGEPPTQMPREAGHLPLPNVALSALAVPVFGAITLVLLWPSLWNETSRGLAVWFTDAYKVVDPEHAVAGGMFGQHLNKAPGGWASLLQFVGWVPLPMLLAWLAGVVATIRSGPGAAWAPLLLTVTTLIVGASAGGLFTGRMSLLPFIWAPTLVTAVIGIEAVATWLGGWRPQWSAVVARAGTGVAVVALTLVFTLAGGYPLGGSNGAEIRQPLPIGLLEHLAAEHPQSAVAVVGGARSWRRGIEVLARYGGFPLKATAAKDADWLLVIEEPGVMKMVNPKVVEILPKGDALHHGRAGGLTFKAYKRK